MNQEIQHPFETDAQKDKNKIITIKLQKYLVDLKDIRLALQKKNSE